MTSKSEKKRPSRRAEPANPTKAAQRAPKQTRFGKAAKPAAHASPTNTAPTDAAASNIAPPNVVRHNTALSQAAPSDAAPASKLDTIVALLRRDGGATLAELVEATGWQAHSVRGALAGSLKKKGYAVMSSKRDGIRRYSIAS